MIAAVSAPGDVDLFAFGFLVAGQCIGKNKLQRDFGGSALCEWIYV